MNLASRSSFVHTSKGLLTHRKILRHGADSFTSPPKEGVLRILSSSKIHCPRPRRTREIVFSGKHASSCTSEDESQSSCLYNWTNVKNHTNNRVDCALLTDHSEGKRYPPPPEGGVGLVPMRGCLLTLAYYAFPRLYEFGERRRNDILTGENRRARRKTCPSATLSTTNPTWIDPGAKPGLRVERPATNDLGHGTARRCASFLKQTSRLTIYAQVIWTSVHIASAIFLKRIGSGTDRLAQNSVWEGEGWYTDGRGKGSGTPFRLVSWGRNSGTAFRDKNTPANCQPENEPSYSRLLSGPSVIVSSLCHCGAAFAPYNDLAPLKFR
jgi:hypothetical protein